MAYPAGFKYTKDHEWIELAGDQGNVGITDYAQQQLGDVVYVELPELGAKLKQGQSFGTIESGADHDIHDVFELVAIIDRLNGAAPAAAHGAGHAVGAADRAGSKASGPGSEGGA